MVPSLEMCFVSLNLSNFKTVFDDNFAYDTTLNSSLWSAKFGNPDQFSFGNGALTLTATGPNWNPVGFLQLDNSKSAGEGYGLYQFSGYLNAHQDKGIAFLLWRADDTYLDASTPNAATEIDVLESWDGGAHGYSTLHYWQPNGNNNGQTNTQLPSSIDVSRLHTYAMDWERGSLTLYVDGKEIYQNTTNVPLDYADGGSNEVMGAEILGETPGKTETVQLHITEMSYSAPVSNLPPPPAPGTVSNVTIPAGSQNFAASAGMLIQAGSGYDTISALSGQVTVTGSDGNLLFFGGSGPSEVNGAYGSLTVFGGAGGGGYTGGAAGHNILISQGASGANTTLTGGASGDELFGSAGGNDTLIAAKGRESILGGGGNDTIVGGGTASSVIFTGSGSSLLYGGNAGGDTIVGGTGTMNVIAQKGDAIFGNTGVLAVSGSTSGADSIIGGAGTLNVAGRGGNMLVVAGSSNSAIQVGTGAALIFTGTGNTTVGGGPGWMELVLGSGKTTVYEGGGPTTYEVVKGAAGGLDLINNFNPAVDKIHLYGYQPADIHTATAGGMTTLSLSDGTKIQMPGISNLGNSLG